MSEQEEDFAAMFEASVKARRFERGQTVQGVIAGFGPKVAFVSIGGKSEAQIDIEELKDEEGDVEVSVGDRIEAMVVATGGGIVLSRKGVRNAATQRELEDAYRAGLSVEGKVEKAVKGGYEVRIAKERAFCPLSQIDIARTEDPSVHEGKTYAFRIIEYKDGGKDLGRLAPPAPRARTEGQGGGAAQGDRPGRGPARPGRVGAGLRRLHRSGRRHPGSAPRLRDELVAPHQPRRDGRRR